MILFVIVAYVAGLVALKRSLSYYALSVQPAGNCMKIDHKFQYVEGSFDTDKGRLVCVQSRKHVSVRLCFKENMNITFAEIKLYSRDRYVDAEAVFEDACKLGDEIVRRWNLISTQ